MKFGIVNDKFITTSVVHDRRFHFNFLLTYEIIYARCECECWPDASNPWCLGSGVGVRSATATVRLDDAGEAAVVLDASLSTARLLLLLFLLLNLRRLALHLAGTSERTVHLTTEQTDRHVELDGVQLRHGRVLGQERTFAGQAQLFRLDRLEVCHQRLDVGNAVAWQDIQDMGVQSPHV